MVPQELAKQCKILPPLSIPESLAVKLLFFYLNEKINISFSRRIDFKVSWISAAKQKQVKRKIQKQASRAETIFLKGNRFFTIDYEVEF